MLVSPLIGVSVVHGLPRLPSNIEWMGLVTVVAILLLCLWKLRHWALGAVLVALLGLAWCAHRAQIRMAELLPAVLEGQVVAVQGRVDSLPQRLVGFGSTEGWRFEFQVRPSVAQDLPPRALLSCYGMPMPPRVGDAWALSVKWRRPHGLMNPQGGDSALWMLSQNIPATGTCSSRGQQRLAQGSGWRIDAWRQAFRESIEQGVADRRGAGVLAALSLGDQGAVRPADWALYRDTGVAHLLSVSGLHVTMFAWLAGGVAGWCWRRSASLCLRWPAPHAALWAGSLAAGLYALFSGWGVPAQRTFGLLLILALLRQCRVQWPWSMSLAVAALAVVLVDPWAPTQPGFWLSFGAVALLMASGGMTTAGSAPAGPRRAKARGPGALDADVASARSARAVWQRALLAGLQSQWVITIGLAPLTLLLFQQLSLVGLVANAVAIPLVSYAITPLALLGIFWSPLWTAGAWLVAGLNLLLEWLQQASGAVWYLPWAPAWAQGLGLVGGLAATIPWGWALRLAGLGLCLPLLWPAVTRPPPGEVELRLPDVGQGGAAVLRTHRYTLVFDAGPGWGQDADAGDRVLLPLLRGLGERRIDLLMVSHADQDHAGGTASLLKGLAVTHRFGAVPQGRPCERGQQWVWDGVRFDVLWPPAGLWRDLTRNGASCVLRVEAHGKRVLLTGDIESAQEARLLALEGAAGSATDVLIVPHHGSRTSSSPAFVAATWPAVAVVQSGYLNRFGHPRAEVVERYRQVGAEVINSVGCGAWMWRSQEADQIPVAGCERMVRRRYWLAAPSTGFAAPSTGLPAPRTRLPAPRTEEAVRPGSGS